MANAMLDARQEGHRIVVTSKWNKIEYRRFSFITGNWRRPTFSTYPNLYELLALIGPTILSYQYQHSPNRHTIRWSCRHESDEDGTYPIGAISAEGYCKRPRV